MALVPGRALVRPPRISLISDRGRLRCGIMPVLYLELVVAYSSEDFKVDTRAKASRPEQMFDKIVTKMGPMMTKGTFW